MILFPNDNITVKYLYTRRTRESLHHLIINRQVTRDMRKICSHTHYKRENTTLRLYMCVTSQTFVQRMIA